MRTRNRLTFTDFILGTAVAFTFLVLFGIVGYFETHYNMDAKVVSVATEKVSVIDAKGEQWTIKLDNTDNINKGDKVSIKFDTNCTDNTREDDAITDYSFK